MSVDFERAVRSASEAHDRALEGAQRGIEIDGARSRKVGRRSDGQEVFGGMGVVAALHDRQVARLRPPFANGHAGDFAHRQSVEHGDRNRPDARFVLHVENGSVDKMPVGIGAVEHHDQAAEIGAGVHHPQHRDIIGIEAQTHVLHVDDQHVERAHRLVRRPFRVAVVERADGNARPGVDRTCDPLPGIGRAAESVLGREDRRDGKPFTVEQVDQMHPPGGIGSRRAGQLRHGGLVGQHGHAPSPQQRVIGRRVGHADVHLRRSGEGCKNGEYKDKNRSLHRAKIIFCTEKCYLCGKAPLP